MAGYIAEFFGYRAEDNSEAALQTIAQRKCPYCGLVLDRDIMPP